MAVVAPNLGRLMRLLNGIGKPKSLQGAGSLAAFAQLLRATDKRLGASLGPDGVVGQFMTPSRQSSQRLHRYLSEANMWQCSTGC